MKDNHKDWLYRRIFNLTEACNFPPFSRGIELVFRLRKILSAFDVSCVLDVGANVGQYRNFLRRRCGYLGPIISFEPTPETFKILQAVAKKDPNWRVFNFALGSADEQRLFHLMKRSAFNSFLKPKAGLCESDIDELNVVQKTEPVQIRRLDDVLRELKTGFNLDRIYLKMDTQGHDLEVIKGIGNELDRIIALQTEVSIKPIYEGMPDYLESLSTLAGLGFAVAGMYEVICDRHFRTIEFDCVAVTPKRFLNCTDEVTSQFILRKKLLIN